MGTNSPPNTLPTSPADVAKKTENVETLLNVKDCGDCIPIKPIKPFVADDTPSFFPSRHVGQFKIFPHGEKACKIVSSPDESMVAISSDKGRIALFLFDKENGYQMDDASSAPSNSPTSTSSISRDYYKHPEDSKVTALAFSPCNRFLAAALYNKQAKTGKFIVFDMSDGGRILHERDHYVGISAISFSGDSKRVAIGGKTGWAIFSVRNLPTSIDSLKKCNNSEYKEGDELEIVHTLSFYPGDDKLVVGGRNSNNYGCFLFDSKGSRVLTELSNEKTYATAFSPDGMIIAVGYCGKTYLVSTASGERIQTFDHASFDIIFSKDGTRVFCRGHKRVIGYDVTSGEKLLKCPDLSGSSPFAVIGGHSMELLIAGDGESIKVFKTGRLKVKELNGYSESAISNDGQMMAFCDINTFQCKLFDATGEEIKSFQDTFDQICCFSVAFSSKGDKFAAGGEGETVVYSVRRKAGESDFEFETLFKIEDYPKQDNGDDYYVIQLFLFAEDGEEKIASVLSHYESNVTVIHIPSVNDFKKRINTTITIPIKQGRVMEMMLPETNQICVKAYDYNNKKWSPVQIYNNKGELEDEKYKNFGNIKAVRLSHDRTKLLVVVDAKLKVYNFSADKGFDAINEASIGEGGLSRDDARAIETISDEYGTSIVAIVFERGSIDVCRFKNWEEGSRLYTIATSGRVEKMFFRPIDAKRKSIDNTGCHLIVASADVTRSYTICLETVSNPTDPFHLLDHCRDEEDFITQCGQANNRTFIPFHQNLNGDTLLYAAFTKGYFEYIRQIIEDSPQAVMALYCTGWDKNAVSRGGSSSKDKNSGHAEQHEEKSRSIIKQYAERNEPHGLERYFHMHESLKCGTSPEKPLDEIVSCIATLAEYKATNALAAILDAGASGCIQGFVPGYKVWLLQANHSSISGKFLKLFKIPGGKQKAVLSTSNISPHTSSLSHAFPFEEYGNDDEKKIQLNACRVLLPNLASQDILEPLLNMSEEYEDGSASLKLFAKRSLRYSINAAWYSWGRKTFFWQFVLYFIWLICVTALAVIRRTNDESGSAAAEAIRLGLIGSVSIGFVYFARIEVMQIRRRGFSQYFNLSWNLQQVLAQVGILLFIVMEIARPSHDATLVLAALSQLLGWINLLYYMRGISEDAAWIIYALLRLIRSMANFLSVLLLAVVACTLFFWSLEELPPDAGSFLHVLLETLSMSFFNNFEPLTNVIDSPFSVFVLILYIMVLVLVTLICMNAMIAFISENFADILDDKIAVMAIEKANMMMDLYCTMSDVYREKLEKDNRWTFKLELQSTLDKIDANSEYLDDGTNKRATKGDIVDLKTESGEKLASMKAEMEETMRAEMKELKAEMEKIMKAEMEKTMKVEMDGMKAEMDGIKADLTEIQKLLQTILNNQKK